MEQNTVEKHNLMLRALRQPGGLLEKAVAMLDQKLEQDPSDPGNLRALGDMLRSKGELERALLIYKKLVHFHPQDPIALQACAILEGKPLPFPPTEMTTAPFVRIEDFLSQEEHSSVLNCLRKKRHAFKSSDVAIRDFPNPRSSQVLYEQDLEDVQTFFTNHVHRTLPEIWPRLGMDPFIPDRTEMQMVSHLDGDYYTIHRDSRDLPGYRRRKLSYVYYFYEEPGEFEGGDLLLYDTDVLKDQCTQIFTALKPLNNSIVFFPSHYYHEVAPVTCKTTDPSKGRNALNGWMRPKPPEPLLPNLKKR